MFSIKKSANSVRAKLKGNVVCTLLRDCADSVHVLLAKACVCMLLSWLLCSSARLYCRIQGGRIFSMDVYYGSTLFSVIVGIESSLEESTQRHTADFRIKAAQVSNALGGGLS